MKITTWFTGCQFILKSCALLFWHCSSTSPNVTVRTNDERMSSEHGGESVCVFMFGTTYIERARDKPSSLLLFSDYEVYIVHLLIHSYFYFPPARTLYICWGAGAEVEDNCTGKRTRTRLGRSDCVPCSDLTTWGFSSENSHSQLYLCIFLDELIRPLTGIRDMKKIWGGECYRIPWTEDWVLNACLSGKGTSSEIASAHIKIIVTHEERMYKRW